VAGNFSAYSGAEAGQYKEDGGTAGGDGLSWLRDADPGRAGQAELGYPGSTRRSSAHGAAAGGPTEVAAYRVVLTARLLIGYWQAGAYIAEEFFGGFSGILGGEVLVENEKRDCRIDFFEGLAGWSAVHRLQASGKHNQFCLGGFEQDAGVVEGDGGHGVVSGAAEHLAQEGADVGRFVDAEHAGPGVGGFSCGILRAQIGGGDGLFHRIVGFKLREEVGHLQGLVDLGRYSAKFQVAA